MIPGLTNTKQFEFYHTEAGMFLIHNGKNIPWCEISQEILDLINNAFNLPGNAVIRNYIKSSINDQNERLKEFCRIVWGQLDHTPDIDENFEYHFESLEDYHLTEREIEFTKLVCKDLTDKEIADRMNIAYNTATTYRQNIETKIGVKSKVGIALFAFKNGII